MRRDPNDFSAAAHASFRSLFPLHFPSILSHFSSYIRTIFSESVILRCSLSLSKFNHP